MIANLENPTVYKKVTRTNEYSRPVDRISIIFLNTEAE